MKTTTILAFTWPRGESEGWSVLADVASLPPLIVYDQGWPLPRDNPYRPLDEVPRLFEELAALGARACQEGERIAIEIDAKVPAWRGRGEPSEIARRGEPLGPPDWSVSAAEDRGIQQRVLRFVRDHGPLRIPRTELTPIGWRVADFISEAYELNKALVLIRQVRSLEKDALDDEERRSDSELSGLQRGLQMAISTYLPVVSLVLLRDDRSGRLQTGFSCQDLISVAWLQAYEAFTGGRSLSTCNGCGRLYAMVDPRQEYHDAGCRNRSNARRSRERQKGAHR